MQLCTLLAPSPRLPPLAPPWQDAADHPEDFADLPTVQQELFAPELEEVSVPGFNPDVDAQPAFERPPLFGRGGRPLIPLHRPAAASDKPAWPRPGAAAEEEPAWARDGPAEEEPAGVMPLLGMLWSRARKPMPRGPAPWDTPLPVGGRPEPWPLVERPHPHPHMPHDMPHHHGWVHRHGPMHGGPMHGGPMMRRPIPMRPGPMPRFVGDQLLVQRRDGHWVPLTDARPGGQGGWGQGRCGQAGCRGCRAGLASGMVCTGSAGHSGVHIALPRSEFARPANLRCLLPALLGRLCPPALP